MDTKKIPFPQADDFEKVRIIVNVDNEEDLKNKEKLSILLGNITERQVSYYLSATIYLGFINEDKKFTTLGENVRKLNYSSQSIEFAMAILRDPVFSKVFCTEKITGVKLDRDEVISIMKQFVHFDNEPMYHRRSQTVIKWIEWVNKEFNK